MKKILILFFLVNAVLGYSQLSVNSTGSLVGTPNTVLITVTDTSDLFAKRDTSSFANGIRNSVESANGYYTIAGIATTTTLTSASAEHIVSFGTITIQLPTPSSCFVGGKTRRFIITKGDLGASTLTITNESGGVISSTGNKGTTYMFVTEGTTWIQCDRN